MGLVAIDTSSGFFGDIDPSDSAETYQTKWSPKIPREGFQLLSSSAGVVQRAVLFSNVVRYCQIDPKDCDVWATVILKDTYETVYLTENESDIITLGNVVVLEGEGHLAVSPENTYLNAIYHLPNVKAVVLESTHGVKHFITVLDKRDIETRGKIYDVEIRMFDQYPDEQFDFSIYCIDKKKEIDMVLKDKEILYYKD